jgi:hypothetical protein
MPLARLLSQRKSVILEQWLARVFETYPDETVRFLREEKDTFRNPVGSVLRHELEAILEWVISASDIDKILPSFDAILRVRAVQDFTASEAVSFLLFLKEVIRHELKVESMEPGLNAELDHLTSRLDALMLTAFDSYVACREQIKDIQISEAHKERDRLLRLLQALTPTQGD